MIGTRSATLFTVFLSFCCLAFVGCDNTSLKNSQSNLEVRSLDSLKVLFANGDMETCIENGKLFSHIYPGNPNGWQILGGAYLGIGEDSLAALMIEKVLEIDPRHSGALVNKAILLDRSEQFEAAKKYYLEAISIDPNLAEAYSNLAGNRLRAGDYAHAIEYGEIATELANKPGDKAILCVAYHKAGRSRERDVLFQQLELIKYRNLSDLKEVIK